jgi:RNA polymerase sigma-70 factor, ECF subfamily
MAVDPPSIAYAVETLCDRGCADGPSLDHRQAQALEVIYRSYAPMLLTVAHRVAGTDIDAEDVLHEVFCRLPWILTQYRGGGLGGWLKRVVQRQALMELRKVRRRREAQLAENSHCAAGEVMPVVFESDDGLQAALAGLPGPLRDVVVLRVFHDFSHQQIARALSISPAASEVRLCRAMKRLRALLPNVGRHPLQRSA